MTMTGTQETTTYEYDARNRLTKETKAQGSVLEYDYDLAGNKVEFTLTVNSTVNVTTYAFDEANRLKTVVDPEEAESSYTYDKVGNRASLRRKGKRRNEARDVAIYLARRNWGMPLRETGEFVGDLGSAAVSLAHRRIAERLPCDPALRRRVAALERAAAATRGGGGED
jgi:YD repeat-containing protein